MSFNCVTTYLRDQFGSVMTGLQNGECRLLELVSEPDDRGFESRSYTPLTGFLPCTWTGKKSDEKPIADKTREFSKYEIKLAQKINAGIISVDPKNRIELRPSVGAAEAITLEIFEIVNKSGIIWQITGWDINK